MIPRLAPIAFALATLLAPHAAAAQAVSAAPGIDDALPRDGARAGPSARPAAAGQSAGAASARQTAPAALRACGDAIRRGDFPARRSHRRQRRSLRRGRRQGRIAHPSRHGARGLAALRFHQRRDLGQGRRSDPPWHRLDHRTRGPFQARHGNGILRLAAFLSWRERFARQRRGNPLCRPRPLRGHRCALHDLRRAAGGLVHPDGRARDRQGANGRHRPRRDGVFLRGAGDLLALVRGPAVERAQIGFSHADHGLDRDSGLRILAALLPQSRAQLRRDDHAPPHDQARPGDRGTGALSLRQRPGRGRRGVPPQRPRDGHEPVRPFLQAHAEPGFPARPCRLLEPQQGFRRHLLRRSLGPRRTHVADDAAARRRVRVRQWAVDVSWPGAGFPDAAGSRGATADSLQSRAAGAGDAAGA